VCGHSSRRQVALPLKRPTRATSRNKLICRPYSVLHPVGFSVPVTLPPPRCALAAPFRPYPSEAGRYAFCGTFPDSLAGPAGRYPAPLFRGARTFLAPLARAAAARSPGMGHIGGTASFFESNANFTNFMGSDAIFVNLVIRVRGIPCPVDDAKEPAFVISRRSSCRTANSNGGQGPLWVVVSVGRCNTLPKVG
jgi:hypothetical protein